LTLRAPAQEAVVVELRRALLLPLDDLLAVTHEFISTAVSRSGLDRCLRRHGVSNLQALKDWCDKRPELFKKRVYNLQGLDKHPPSIRVPKSLRP